MSKDLKSKEKKRKVTIKADSDESDLEEQLVKKPKTNGRRSTKKKLGDFGETQADVTIVENPWKVRLHESYETLVLGETRLNKRPRPCGFRSNGKWRKLKNTCLISKIKNLHSSRGTKLKMAVCITMYNEDLDELKVTLKGVM